MDNKKRIKSFMLENFGTWFIVIFFLLMVYGIKLFNISISHDTEAIMAVPESLYESWIALGRFGLVFQKKIFGMLQFNPYIAVYLMLVLMIVNTIVWEYLFCALLNDWNIKNKWIFPVLFFTSRIYVEQNAFILQSVEINLSLLFIAISLYLFFVVSGRAKYIVIVLLNTIAFASYQSFVPLYIAGVCGCFFLKIKARRKDDCSCSEDTPKDLWKKLVGVVVIFGVSFLLYQIINNIVLEQCGLVSSSYISNQVGWFSKTGRECISEILQYLRYALLGGNIFYCKYFGSVMLIFTLVSIYDLLKKDIMDNQLKLFFGLIVFGCVLSPFLMTFVLGSAPLYRSDIVLPFMVAFMCQYLVMRLCENDKVNIHYRVYKGVIVLSVIFISHFQSIESSKLMYTEYVKNVEDMQLAIKISDRIEQLDLGESPEEPVVFIGSRMANTNLSCVDKKDISLVGYSFYELSFYTMHGTWVMNHYMNTLGYKYNMPTNEQVEKAEALSVGMPSWPNKGSVTAIDGVIIIKLN